MPGERHDTGPGPARHRSARVSVGLCRACCNQRYISMLINHVFGKPISWHAGRYTAYLMISHDIPFLLVDNLCRLSHSAVRISDPTGEYMIKIRKYDILSNRPDLHCVPV